MQQDDTLPPRVSFLLVGVWWLGFAQFTLRRLPRGTPADFRPQFNILTNGFIELKKVWNEISHQPLLKRYLTAYFFYNMGVQTVMLVATVFGTKELSLPMEKLIITLLIIQLVAIPGAWGMAKLSGIFGNLTNPDGRGGYLDFHLCGDLFHSASARPECECRNAFLYTRIRGGFGDGWHSIPEPVHLFQTDARNT